MKIYVIHICSFTHLFQVLSPTGSHTSELTTNRDDISKWPQRYTGKTPSNHFTLNDDQDCLKAMEWLKENFINSEGKGFGKHTHLQKYSLGSLFPWLHGIIDAQLIRTKSFICCALFSRLIYNLLSFLILSIFI